MKGNMEGNRSASLRLLCSGISSCPAIVRLRLFYGVIARKARRLIHAKEVTSGNPDR
jgi:hypothetical protein